MCAYVFVYIRACGWKVLFAFTVLLNDCPMITPNAWAHGLTMKLNVIH